MNLFLRIALFWMLGMGTAAAQPSDAEVKRHLKSRNSKITSIKLARGGGVTTRVIVKKGVWYDRYSRGYTIKMRTPYKGVTYVLRGEHRYHRIGGTWKFIRSFIQEGTYEGVPSPTASDVLKLANADLEKALAGPYSSIVGELVTPLALADEPRWIWHSLESVSVRLVASYRVKADNTTVQTVKQLFELRLYRDDMKKPFDRFISKPISDTGARTVLDTKTYATAAEVRALPMLKTIRAEAAAKREAAKRPKVRVPEFRSTEDAARYVHSLLRSGRLDTFKAGLEPLLASSAYEPGSTVRHSYETTEMFKKIGYKIANYKAQYCRNLVILKADDRRVIWESRTPKMKTSVSFHMEGGKIRIKRVYVGAVRPESSITKGMTDAKCK